MKYNMKLRSAIWSFRLGFFKIFMCHCS